MNIVITEKEEANYEPTADYEPTAEYEPTYCMDQVMANEINYLLNYTLPMLQHICAFYELPYKRIKKNVLVSTIVDYESNSENIEHVEYRKRLWFYMEELKKNKYLSKYIISM